MNKRKYAKKPVQKTRNDYVHKVARLEAKKVIKKTIETKMFDGATTTSTTVDYSGVVFPMLADPSGSVTIQGGISDNQYIGTKITLSGIRLRYAVTVADTYNMVRIIVIQTKGGYIPSSGADILQSVSNIRAPLSDFEIDYENRYTVLYDKLLDLANVGDNIKTRTVWISGKKLRRVTFVDMAGTVEDGGIYMLAISDSSSGNPGFLAYWRDHYKDA